MDRENREMGMSKITPNSRNQFLPCPFCESANVRKNSADITPYIECVDCGATCGEWNNRPQPKYVYSERKSSGMSHNPDGYAKEGVGGKVANGGGL